MTEAEWLACDDPQAMLEAVRYNQHRFSHRKARLFGCACCRHVPAVMAVEVSLPVVEAVEKFADGQISQQDFSKVWSQAFSFYGPGRVEVCDLTPARLESLRSRCAAASPNGVAERRYQVKILRDIYGERLNGWLPAQFNPVWRTSDVLLLAQGIYDDRAFDRMPILADALQDAGCDNGDILNHLRVANQIHVRGCWVVDLVLGKA